MDFLMHIYMYIYSLYNLLCNSFTNTSNRPDGKTFEMEIRRIENAVKVRKLHSGLEFTRMHVLCDQGLFARNIGGCFICRGKAFRQSAGSKAEILAARKYERKLDLRQVEPRQTFLGSGSSAYLYTYLRGQMYVLVIYVLM